MPPYTLHMHPFTRNRGERSRNENEKDQDEMTLVLLVRNSIMDGPILNNSAHNICFLRPHWLPHLCLAHVLTPDQQFYIVFTPS
jgi:hypothetical protein